MEDYKFKGIDFAKYEAKLDYSTIEKILRERLALMQTRYANDPKYDSDFHLGVIAGLGQAVALFEDKREQERGE